MARKRSASSASRRSAKASSRSRAGADGAPTSPRATRDHGERRVPRDRGRRRTARRAGRPADRSRRPRRRCRGAGGTAGRRHARDGVSTAGGHSSRAGVQAMTVEMDAHAIVAAVRARRLTARDVMAAALDGIELRDGALNCFTLVRRDAALAEAATIDARIAAGRDPGPLAGVPFAAKNRFDIAGATTVAGSTIHADHAPATRDAFAVAALRQAGAVLVGATNMDEYAYGFSTENAHYGPTRNPHDPTRIAGGSSGGSAAAVAAGLVPLALGTDTNGSIRVPAALCGVFGLKPTFGRVSRAGVVPLAWSFDHVGPFPRHVADLATAFDPIQGPDPTDQVCAERQAEP